MYERFGRAEKLLMRIRAVKWQATTILSSSPDGRAREEAAAIVAELQALDTAAREATTEDAMGRCEEQVQAIDARLGLVRAH